MCAQVMDVETAILVYRQLGDAGMVLGLEQIQPIENRNLLAGHVSLLFCNYYQAQELFLSSSHPVAALEMHRDLLHWDQALRLAHTLAPKEVSEISLQVRRRKAHRDVMGGGVGLRSPVVKLGESP
jgi:WD repeat-containing protein 19